MTERKQAEDALRRSEDHLRLVIDTIPTMAWSLRPDGILDFVNQRWLDYTGISFEQAIEEPTRTVHPEDLSRVMEKWLVIKATVEAYEDEMRLQRADGEYRWFLIRIAPVLDKQGNLLKRYGVAIDIEERKRAEDALRRSEDRIRLSIDTIPTMVWSLQPDGAIDFVNQRWMDYTGLSLEEAIAEPTRPMHPEDLPGAMAEWGANMAAEEPFEEELRLRRADGEYRWFLIRTDPLRDEQGRIVKWYGVSIDIEDRKRAEQALRAAEQKYRDIFENAGEGIFQSTPDGRYVAANPALARIYGFASPEELMHSRQDISLEVYVDPTRRKEFKLQLEQQGAVRGFEHEVFRKDGSRIWISVNARAVRGKQGDIHYYEGTAQDITERKAAEEKLKATSEQLRALSARLQSAREEEGTRIAREIHDELGSMLTTLKWDLEEIQKTLSTSIDQLQLTAVREKLQALMKLTDMSVSTLRRIASELRPSILDDLGLVPAIEWQAQQFQTRTGIICNCDCSLNITELSEEQSTAVFRIYQEALTNVLRHARATRVDIRIEKVDGYFALSIRDNGKGISHSERSAQKSLGILGMRERAHLIGGEVSITGAEGQGAVVTVRVPIAGRDVVRRMSR
jgi:PAS domain S-box-containing protein